MRIAKLGVLAALIVLTILALLWVTEAVPREQLTDIAPKALGAILVLEVAALIWSRVRGRTRVSEGSEKPVP
jgi:hypothetical protein